MAEKEVEKLEKYQLLKDETIKIEGVKKVVVVPVVIGVLGVVSMNFKKYVKKLEIDACVEVMQKRDSSNKSCKVTEERFVFVHVRLWRGELGTFVNLMLTAP